MNKMEVFMGRILALFPAVMCFMGAPGQTGYKEHSRNVNYDAAGIERNAQLVNCRFDRDNGIIRLDSTELVEDDAPAAGQPEGYKVYNNGPVEWVEDLRKGIVLKKVFFAAKHPKEGTFKWCDLSRLAL